jgi:hypothetical protein
VRFARCCCCCCSCCIMNRSVSLVILLKHYVCPRGDIFHKRRSNMLARVAADERRTTSRLCATEYLQRMYPVGSRSCQRCSVVLILKALHKLFVRVASVSVQKCQAAKGNGEEDTYESTLCSCWQPPRYRPHSR